MREIWDHPFGYALLKIERANDHIADIQSRLHASSDDYGPSLHVDGKTGEQFLYYKQGDRYLRSDIALMAGDAVHNLRSALDIAWVETIKRVSPASLTKWTQFTVPDSKTKLVGDLTKTGKIDPASELFDFMVNRVKSYEGGDTDIVALHNLDVDDKHRLLIPVVAVTGIKGVELKNEDGSVDVLDIAITRPNAFRKVVGLETQLQNHGEVVFHVTFGKGAPGEDFEVIPTLMRYSKKVERIVRTLQRLTS